MVGDQVRPGRGDEGGEFLEQGQRIEEKVGRAVGVGGLEPEADPAVGKLREPLVGEGRAGGVAAEPLDPVAVPGADAGAGVQGEAARAGGALLLGGGGGPRILPSPSLVTRAPPLGPRAIFPWMEPAWQASRISPSLSGSVPKASWFSEERRPRI